MTKKAILETLLRDGALQECLAAVRDAPGSRRRLLSLLYATEDGLRMRAAALVGLYAAELAPSDPAAVRRILQQLLWSMNDESGSVCRSAPEAMGEILARIPGLRKEYAPLLASFIHEEPFEAGALWALWRIGPEAAHVLGERIPEVEALLASPDPRIAGGAVKLLSVLGHVPPVDTRRALLARTEEEFRWHDPATRSVEIMTLAGAARRAWPQ